MGTLSKQPECSEKKFLCFTLQDEAYHLYCKIMLSLCTTRLHLHLAVQLTLFVVRLCFRLQNYAGYGSKCAFGATNPGEKPGEYSQSLVGTDV